MPALLETPYIPATLDVAPEASPAPGRSDVALEPTSARRRFALYAWGLLLFNFIVIVVGTVVRATGSGDGCGAHWPLCDGQVIPVAPSVARIIEFTHRVVSGVDGPAVLALVAGGFLLYPRRHPIRKAVVVTLVLTLVEALIGALLVKKRLVADNASVQRAVWMSVHLVNTFFLLTALSLSAWWATVKGHNDGVSTGAKLKWAGQGVVGGAVAFGAVSLLLLGVSGAVTALGDTLFPVKNHAEALTQAQTGKHFLQQLRLWHPYIAGSVGLYILLLAGLVAHLRPSHATKRWGQTMGYLFLAQIVVGYVNVLLRAPVWMQVVHLLMADLVWVTFALQAYSAFAEKVPQVEQGATANDEMRAAENDTLGRPTLGDYVILTKPRVISLLLFTTLTAMFMAAGGWPGTIPFVAVALGGYMAAGAANAINMVIDRDIDVRMKRTSTRPTVTQKIPSPDALRFGLGLAFASFVILWAGANLLTAMLGLAGLVCYVIVYTLLLKRRTWHNIVIGGAAGAIPPLVGWAAVTGDLKSALAWYLFGIVFLWTPAHFWALALLIKDDYKEAGVPMLPVVMGDRVTVIQIGIYAILTAIISLAPLMQGFVGPLYIVVAVLLNIVFLAMAAQLYKQTDRPRASRVFHYSMAYLALLFLALAIDRGIRL
jgi:protoheme IX farnesyltransferase